MVNSFLSSVYSLLGKTIDIPAEADVFLMGVLTVLLKIFISFIVFFVGKRVIKWILQLFERFLTKAQVEKSIISFLASLARIVLFIILLSFIANILGIMTTSFVAIIGSMGLALGLSLQGSLSNFAGGVLILILKPYKVGDYIIAMGNEGTVAAIDIFYTQLLTPDNRRIVMPNGSLSNNSIINVTHEPIRRLELDISVPSKADLAEVKELLLDLYIKSEKTVKDREPEVFINSFDSQAVLLKFRMWTAKEDYGNLKEQLLEGIKTVFEEKEIGIPHTKTDVFVK